MFSLLHSVEMFYALITVFEKFFCPFKNQFCVRLVLTHAVGTFKEFALLVNNLLPLEESSSYQTEHLRSTRKRFSLLG